MALRWAMGYISFKDVTKIIGSSSSAYIYLARALRDHISPNDRSRVNRRDTK